jgi:hypothetical protein
VVTVSRSQGLYAGAVGEALIIDPDKKETAKLLGTTKSLVEVLIKGTVPVPEKTKAFIAAVAASEWTKVLNRGPISAPLDLS